MEPSFKPYDNPERLTNIEQIEPDIDIPDGDPARGERIFKAVCTSCHQLDTNGFLGPRLRDVFERKIASVRGFSYSLSMTTKRSGYWTKKRLYLYLKNPEAMFPETTMYFEGIKDPYDRASVVEYLIFLKSTVNKNNTNPNPRPNS